MEYKYLPEHCWHDNAEVYEGSDGYEPEGKQNWYGWKCPDCCEESFKEW